MWRSWKYDRGKLQHDDLVDLGLLLQSHGISSWYVTAGERVVAVAWAGCQRTAASNTERTQIRFDCDRLLLQVGGSCAYAVMPPVTCGQTHRGHNRPLWIPVQNPLSAASWHCPQSECTADTRVNYQFYLNIYTVHISFSNKLLV